MKERKTLSEVYDILTQDYCSYLCFQERLSKAADKVREGDGYSDDSYISAYQVADAKSEFTERYLRKYAEANDIEVVEDQEED